MPNKPRLRFSCTWNTLQIWGLLENEEIIHLSFDREGHRAAANQQTLAAASPARQEQICALLLSTLQGAPHTYPGKSPFIQKGTPFQNRVWQALSRIPYATTRSYGEIARELGNPHLARAVGQACNKNPLPLIIPCHRVVGRTDVGGFSGGVEVKKLLLGYEQAWAEKRSREIRS
ncbi:MAG: methylated-DNA--[protein]-cysteine S-methyltransferase [Proteobacteria bacterium]|nr:methylated-DNA--[protein]-cysteine S-methyltransferase [Pseudomonadota bacterium]MBU1639429.1 methylated-DNA--[protein]-cysteine S-methyltransferase [Pseudomonadota bacterium]